MQIWLAYHASHKTMHTTFFFWSVPRTTTTTTTTATKLGPREITCLLSDLVRVRPFSAFILTLKLVNSRIIKLHALNCRLADFQSFLKVSPQKPKLTCMAQVILDFVTLLSWNYQSESSMQLKQHFNRNTATCYATNCISPAGSRTYWDWSPRKLAGGAYKTGLAKYILSRNLPVKVVISAKSCAVELVTYKSITHLDPAKITNRLASITELNKGHFRKLRWDTLFVWIRSHPPSETSVLLVALVNSLAVSLEKFWQS